MAYRTGIPQHRLLADFTAIELTELMVVSKMMQPGYRSPQSGEEIFGIIRAAGQAAEGE